MDASSPAHASPRPPDGAAAAKSALRAALRAARRAREPGERALVATEIAARAVGPGPLADVLAEPLSRREAPVVAAYTSTPAEPGTQELVAALLAAGARVLLPVVAPDRTRSDGRRAPAPLDWVDTEGAAGDLSRADAVLLPALAVDRSGALVREEHDVGVDAALTPGGWVRLLVDDSAAARRPPPITRLGH